MAKLMKIFVEWRHETNSAIPALTVAFCFASALDQYGEWQQLESTQMLAEYLHHPDQWYAHHYRYASSVVHRVALGVRVEASSEDLGNLQKIATEFTGSIGSCLVDWFPAVAMIPRPFSVGAVVGKDGQIPQRRSSYVVRPRIRCNQSRCGATVLR